MLGLCSSISRRAWINRNANAASAQGHMIRASPSHLRVKSRETLHVKHNRNTVMRYAKSVPHRNSSQQNIPAQDCSAPFHYVSYCFSSQIKGLLGVRVPTHCFITQNSLLTPEESIPETDCHTEESGFGILPQSLLSGVEIEASPGLAFQPRPWHHQAGLGYHASHRHCLWRPTASSIHWHVTL